MSRKCKITRSLTRDEIVSSNIHVTTQYQAMNAVMQVVGLAKLASYNPVRSFPASIPGIPASQPEQSSLAKTILAQFPVQT